MPLCYYLSKKSLFIPILNQFSFVIEKIFIFLRITTDDHQKRSFKISDRILFSCLEQRKHCYSKTVKPNSQIQCWATRLINKSGFMLVFLNLNSIVPIFLERSLRYHTLCTLHFILFYNFLLIFWKSMVEPWNSFFYIILRCVICIWFAYEVRRQKCILSGSLW